MPGFMVFAYWVYLLPACLAALLGLLAVNAGKVPEELKFMPKESFYPSIMISALLPIYNIIYFLSSLASLLS